LLTGKMHDLDPGLSQVAVTLELLLGSGGVCVL